ncbi:tail protein X [Serratia sp. 14-2641]|uniref:tail protein X n=1 Tax=Serratia sp. 14-2641 TaxID=1841657 RepID=UPI00080FF8A4|nr:tail protein X [Serratia sp. 14-2641]OCJ24576.1 phage tail protein [Serratia sp. 14-2641]
MEVIALQGDTLDALCHRHYGRTEGVVEAVLLVNPGLAEVGVILPHGTVWGGDHFCTVRGRLGAARKP